MNAENMLIIYMTSPFKLCKWDTNTETEVYSAASQVKQRSREEGSDGSRGRDQVLHLGPCVHARHTLHPCL